MADNHYFCLAGHQIKTYSDTIKFAERLQDAECVILTQQRSAFPRALIERLSHLKLITQH